MMELRQAPNAVVRQVDATVLDMFTCAVRGPNNDAQVDTVYYCERTALLLQLLHSTLAHMTMDELSALLQLYQ